MTVLEAPRVVTPDAPVRLVHLASKSSGYNRAYCGKVRDRPLNRNAEGELCVVCAAMKGRG
jgi:hypothetical protein